MDIAKLLLEVQKYIQDESELELIKVAFQIADSAHKGQKRESGLDYISHPLEVAHILATMHQYFMNNFIVQLAATRQQMSYTNGRLCTCVSYCKKRLLIKYIW